VECGSQPGKGSVDCYDNRDITSRQFGKNQNEASSLQRASCPYAYEGG
jgi:hypothetical protein